MGDLAEIFENTRTGRAFDLEIITVKKMVAFKGLKNQVDNRETIACGGENPSD
jgi:hypothetical protein